MKWVSAGDHFERVHGVGVGRVGHRQRELVLVFGQRQRMRIAKEARRHALLKNGQLRITGSLDKRQTELQCKRLGNVALRNHTERYEQNAADCRTIPDKEE